MTPARGSTWAKWDLHVHSPASFNWSGGKLTPTERAATLGSWVAAINGGDVVAFAIMDYWTFDGVLALREHSRTNPGLLKKTVFPGIELRIQSPTSHRLNIHAILSDTLTDQELRDFLSELKVQIIDGPLRNLSDEGLRAYARSLRDDQLAQHNLTRAQLQDDDHAWRAGCQTAEVTLESFRTAMKSLPQDSAVVFQPWDTYGGLKELKWQNHYTSAHQLFSQPDIFECKSEPTRDALVGKRTEGNAGWFDGFWKALGERPRLPVRGSDAHSFANYGKFQSSLPTWIKAAPTFRGLLQAIKEPAQRSWLGEQPPKLERVQSKPSVFIDKLSLKKPQDHGLANEDWFDGEELYLNPDLVAVIGNKGSGKSALADIVALLGDTSNVDSFSFLTGSRFRDKKNNRSLHFEASLTWANSLTSSRRLSVNPDPSAVERVRYVPQSFFERVCSGQSDADLREFTSQIERVIFAHVPSDLRGDAEDLSELLSRHEVETSRRVQTLRSDLEEVNAGICDLRRRTSKSARDEMVSLLALRQQQLADLKAVEPPEPDAGGTSPVDDDPKVAALNALVVERVGLDTEIAAANQALGDQQARYQAASRLLSGMSALAQHVKQEANRLRADATTAGLDIDTLVQVQIDEPAVTSVQSDLQSAIALAKTAITGDQADSLASRAKALQTKIDQARADLGSAQLAVQAARERRTAWERDVTALEGPSEVTTSIAHIATQIAAVDAGPDRIEELIEARNALAKDIVDALLQICASRDTIVKTAKATIDELLPEHPGFSLDFVNEMFVSELEERFFQLVKQVSGTFRGEDEGRRSFRDFVDSRALGSAEDIVALATGLEAMLVRETKGADVIEHDIDTLVRKGRSTEEVLNLLYGFEYLQPRFTLAHGGQPLTQLSPGQRGAMLLVFFLLVEDSDLPIVLDQPEENLDNETVYSLLVPAIKRAKERRQIIMVTHNANLAVCCDAEQVIHASFDRAHRSKMAYRSGPIEDSEINALVVNVLEGTRPAFDNRRGKYGAGG